MRALSVYLDSNDYSDLSNPRMQSAETTTLRARLQAWSDTGQVEFWYSAAHITEMAPLGVQYSAAANARARIERKPAVKPDAESGGPRIASPRFPATRTLDADLIPAATEVSAGLGGM